MFAWLKKIAGRTDQAPVTGVSDAALARRYLALTRSGTLRTRPDHDSRLSAGAAWSAPGRAGDHAGDAERG